MGRDDRWRWRAALPQWARSGTLSAAQGRYGSAQPVATIILLARSQDGAVTQRAVRTSDYEPVIPGPA